MPDVYLSRQRHLPLASLLITLTLLSPPGAWAQQRQADPDCQAVAGAAQAARERTLGSIDSVTTSTQVAIQRAKSCVDQILGGTVRAIPSFGGGVMDTIANRLSRDLANQACQLLSSSQGAVQRQVQTQVGGVLGSAAGQAAGKAAGQVAGQASGQILQQTTPTAPPPPSQPTTTAPPSDSVWKRLGNMF